MDLSRLSWRPTIGRHRRFALPLLLLLAVTSAYVALTHWVLPPRLFRKAVLDPIPPSVRIIRGSGFFMSEASHIYVLRFSISQEDVRLILSSGPFKEIGYVRYSSGILAYGERQFKSESSTRYQGDEMIGSYEYNSDAGSSFMLFKGWRKWLPPRWFQFGKWHTFKAYVVEREDTSRDFYETRLLIHNPDAGQAYFIKFQARGT